MRRVVAQRSLAMRDPHTHWRCRRARPRGGQLARYGRIAATLIALLLPAGVPAAAAEVLGVGQLAVERRGHSATVLPDGHILVVGGENAAGPVGVSELIDPSSGAVAPGPTGDARTDHSATLLADGRVLIAGGQDAGGRLATTRFFDPATRAFRWGPTMARARAGHTATLLGDGRLLVAGGDEEGSAEVFDPSAAAFVLLGYRLTSARAFHGAALLPDGNVLLAGGAQPDGAWTRTAELFESSTSSFRRLTRPMARPRFSPVLTVLPDGKVQVIGGDDAGTMEVYSADSRLFNALVHLPPSASLLPETLRSRARAALFTPAVGENPALASAAPYLIELLGREDHTVTEAPAAGRAVVAGGVDGTGRVSGSIAVFESSAATVTTGQADYAPGETVVISGAGWQPGETVAMTIREEPETHPDVTTSSVADEAGRFVNTEFVPGLPDAGRAFTITAVGLSSDRTAQTAFSDALGFSLEQCHNGTVANLAVPCGTSSSPTPPDWATGDVNHSNSEYAEADGLPFRLIVSNLTDGTWTVRLRYDFTKGGISAVDRLTRFDLTQASNPCLDNTDIACAVGSPAFDFEIPGEVVTPSATEPALPNTGALSVARSPFPLAAADLRMTAWVEGGTATFISTGQNDTGVQATSFNDNRVLQNGLATGDSDREFALKFSLSGCPAAGCTAMLAWTAHFASAADWGVGKGAGTVSGSPFHMTLVGVDNGDGTSGGNRDRSAKLGGDLVTGGTIVIKKVTDPASDTTTSFGFAATGGISPAGFTLKNGGTTTFVSVAPGTYTVTESAVPAGWALTKLTCIDPTGNTTTSLATAKATIDVASGETVTCTFTNTQSGSLVVTKVTIPNDTTTGFPIAASGSGSISGNPSQTVKTGAPVTYAVTAGTYSVAETPPAGWTETGNTCKDVAVTAGQSASCTITNTQASTLTVTKVTIPNDTTTGFPVTASGSGTISGNANQTVKTGAPVTYTVTAGTYSVSETPPAGWTETGNTCKDVTVTTGQSASCTITNTQASTLTVTKVTIPNDTTTGFAITASGSGTISGNPNQTVKTGAPVTYTLTPGTYSVNETPPAGWTETGNTCTGVTVAAGQSASCTITNTQSQQNVTATLIVIKHVVNNNGGTKRPADFNITVSGTAVPGSTSFPGADSPGTSLTVTPGTYTVSETVLTGYVPSFSGDCTNVTIAAGETRTCTITNTDVRPAPPNFCSKTSVSTLLSPTGVRFKNNKGIDNLVRVDLGESIQDAVNTATDANNDGYIIIGVVAGPGTPAPYGGHTSQRVTIDRQYGKPFALVGCSVTLHDPDAGDGRPAGLITAAASSPVSTSNPASILVVDLHGADSEIAGWTVEGAGRELRNVNASANQVGISIAGNGNSVVNGVVQGNRGVGVRIAGDRNVLDSTSTMANQGHGVQVTGHSNQLKKLNTGDVGKGNQGDGANIVGNGNLLSETSAFANAGHGISLGGASNQVLKAFSGDKGKGNGGDGIRVTGTDTLVQDSRTNANRGDGVSVAGGTASAANRLKYHQSNTGLPASATENGVAEYRLLNYVKNDSGNNRADGKVVPKATSPAKCPAFPATNATVNFSAVMACE